MNCPNCGKYNPEGSNYCNNCGVRLDVLNPATIVWNIFSHWATIDKGPFGSVFGCYITDPNDPVLLEQIRDHAFNSKVVAYLGSYQIGNASGSRIIMETWQKIDSKVEGYLQPSTGVCVIEITNLEKTESAKV